ncbi:MAG: SDR family oxidoreductase, partial [Myxococcota bacterium]
MSILFFTGFPGFLGRELLPRLLTRHPDRRAVCLIQGRYRAQAEEARLALGQREPRLPERIELVEGDITEVDLGLSAEVRTGLYRDTVEVYHLAAVYDLAVGRHLAHRVNVDGTSHVLDFCEGCTSLGRLHYVSTCFVSGRYAGPFSEDDLQLGQRFNNHYEETKHLAEVEVRRRASRIRTTVYRPAVVVGDSKSGATQKYDGPYYAIRFLLRQRGPIAAVPMVGDPSAVRLNVVPRDFVVDAITHLSQREESAGVTYQLADPQPLTIEEQVAAMERAVGKKLWRIHVPLSWAKTAIDRVPGVRGLMGFPSHAIDYYVHPTHYLTAYAQRDLAPAGIH